MPFEFETLAIPEILHITPKQFGDERGVFSEVFKASDFAAAGMQDLFVQVNKSTSKKDVLRGLHYQKQPRGQGKLVTVLTGEIYDVAVDIRQGSPTFGKWVAKTLSSREQNMLYVPAGFAHGFCVTSAEAEVMYFCTNEYAPEAEAGIIWNDPDLAISWPTDAPLLSAKDEAFPTLREADNNFQYE